MLCLISSHRTQPGNTGSLVGKFCSFMTSTLLALIRKRKSVFKKLKATNFRDESLSVQFKRLRNQCNNLYRHLQNLYFSDECQRYEREPWQYWKALNMITKRSPPKQTVTIPPERLNDSLLFAILLDFHLKRARSTETTGVCQVIR